MSCVTKQKGKKNYLTLCWRITLQWNNDNFKVLVYHLQANNKKMFIFLSWWLKRMSELGEYWFQSKTIFDIDISIVFNWCLCSLDRKLFICLYVTYQQYISIQWGNEQQIYLINMSWRWKYKRISQACHQYSCAHCVIAIGVIYYMISLIYPKTKHGGKNNNTLQCTYSIRKTIQGGNLLKKSKLILSWKSDKNIFINIDWRYYIFNGISVRFQVNEKVKVSTEVNTEIYQVRRRTNWEYYYLWIYSFTISISI